MAKEFHSAQKPKYVELVYRIVVEFANNLISTIVTDTQVDSDESDCDDDLKVLGRRNGLSSPKGQIILH